MKTLKLFSNRFLSNKVFKNTIVLGCFQIVNYVFPLLTVPYLIRVLGVEGFGVISLSQVIAGYLSIVTDYGFNMSATRLVAINKNNPAKVNELFNTVIVCKSLIASVGIVILSCVFFAISSIEQYRGIYLIASLVVLGQVLFPIWLFQGMQHMVKVVIFSSLFKFIFTVCVFIFVKGQNDLILVSWFYALGSIVSGFAAFVYAIRKYNLKLTFVNRENIFEAFKDGFDVFMPSFFSSILSNGGVLLLGVFHSATLVGIYSGIDKLVKAGVSLLSSVTQALFPDISHKFSVSKKLAIATIKRVCYYLLMILIPLFFIISLLSSTILNFLYENVYYQQYSYVLVVLLVWVLVSFLNNFLGIQFLVGSGQSKYYKKSFLYSSILTIASFLSIKFFSINGVLLSLIVGELTLTFFMVFYIRKNKLYEE